MIDTRFVNVTEQMPLDLVELGGYLTRQGLNLDERSPVRQFRAGLANINYLLVVDGEQLVLRRPPTGELPPGAHDMSREHHILSRLWRRFPLAPRGVHLCEDTDIIGVPFQLIEFRDGVSISADDPDAGVGIQDGQQRIARMLIDTLVQLHAVDAGDVGLENFAKPVGFVTRAVAGWSRRAGAFNGAPRTLAEEIAGWLGERVDRIGSREPTLLHSDFKLDNVLLRAGTLEPVAVVDWDMGTRGDPLFDVATLLSYWSQADDPSCMQRLAQMPTAHPGFPDRAWVLDEYEKATGCDLTGFEVLRVLGLYKLGLVFLQLHARWSQGGIGDDRYREFDSLGVELLEFARDVSLGRYL